MRKSTNYAKADIGNTQKKRNKRMQAMDSKGMIG